MPGVAALAPAALGVVHTLAPMALALAQALFSWVLPTACAFCASSSQTNKAAYIGTTLLLLGLPAGMLAALILWLIRRAR